MSVVPADQPVALSCHADDREAHDQHPTPRKTSTEPSIVDGYADVLEVLSPNRRRGLVAQIAIGFYDGWRPGRAEVADIVAVELGMLTMDECVRRRGLRNDGYWIPEIDVFKASPKRSGRPSRRVQPQSQPRNHRGQWTNQNPPISFPCTRAPHHEGQS
jgi:hypothetical protein